MTDLSKTLPASWYFDSKIFQAERQFIFGREWIYARDSENLKKPGDYVGFDLAGYPILLVMGHDQEIRAFHNVCPHRASPLVTSTAGCAKSNGLTCRYHGWTFDLAGKLVQAPLFDSVLQSCSDSGSVGLNLYEIRASVFNGLVFVNLDLKAPPLKEALRSVEQEIENSRVPVAQYTETARMVKEGNFNWKVWVDGFQECYHCPTIHPVFNKDFALRSYQVRNADGYSVHSCQRKTESVLGGFEGLWLWVYPNLGMPFYEPCCYTLQVNPLSATKTQLNYYFRFKQTVSERGRADFIALIEKITMEDITVCEQVQRNLEAGVYQTGFLNPERENGVIYFQSLVKKALTPFLAP